ncbi:MAG TPA: hypothetical protein DCY86_14325 [Bdellovibrionales bacterium]|nr:hypothetical protein [Bdellovibrionales bacterium]
MDSSSHIVFLNSFLLILRAGFEAIIVVSAICTYLRKTGQEEKISSIYKGALAAVAASFLTMWIVQALFIRSGEAREAIEGFTMLSASVLLVFVGYWFLRMSNVDRWHEYMNRKIRTSAEKSNIFALSAMSFLTVYREGAETVIFYQALQSSYHGSNGTIIIGFLAGLALLTLVFIALRFTAMKVPSGVFFTGTALLLFYIAFTLAGHGVLELQEAGLVSVTNVESLQAVKTLRVFPTYEGLAVQGILLASFIAVLLTRLRSVKKKFISAS